VDISHPKAEEEIRAVNMVLDEIGAAGKPTLMVFNKVDRVANGGLVNRNLERFPNTVAVSAATGEGFPALLEELGSQLRPARDLVELEVPHSEPAVIARLHAVGQVLERDYNGESARFKARIPPHLRAEFSPFIVQDLRVA